jgi:hypothetical protein
VIVTSNDERRLPDAFLRRCIFHRIELDEKLVEAAVESMAGADGSGFPNLDADTRAAARRRFWQLREVQGLDKKPSTAELLTWLCILSAQRDGCRNPGGLPARQAASPRRPDQGRRRPRPVVVERCRATAATASPNSATSWRRCVTERRPGGSWRDRASAPCLRLQQPRLDHAGLKALLAALLVKTPAQRQVFEGLFAAWCPDHEADWPAPEPATAQSPSDRRERSSRAFAPIPFREPPPEPPPDRIKQILIAMRRAAAAWHS